MTNPNLTALTFVIDESGSMGNVREEIRTGFNRYINEQKAQPGQAIVTLVKFNDAQHIQTVFENQDIQQVRELELKDYTPGGSTALLDAIGQTINKTGAYYASLPVSERPGKVLFVIQTDGEENASREFNYDQIKTMIRTQEENFNWEVIFTAADIDVAKNAQRIGASSGKSRGFSKSAAGVNDFYGDLSLSTSSYRAGAGFTPQDPQAANKPQP